MKHAPDITDRVPFHKPMERPHGTRITLKGTSAIKEISNSQSFFAEFGHSFEAIQVTLCSTWPKDPVAWTVVAMGLLPRNDFHSVLLSIVASRLR